MIELGYESSNLVKNVGTLGVIIGIYLLRVILHIFGKFVCLFLKMENWLRLSKFLKIISDNLYFGNIISISLEAYLEFIWMGYIAIIYSGFQKNGDIISFMLGVSFEIVALILLPILFFINISQKKLTLQ